MNASDIDNTDEAERQRAEVRSLCRDHRYEDAADLCRTLSDGVLIFTPCEAIADFIHNTRLAEAVRLYEIRAEFYRYEGTQATGSGEGIAAMDNLRRVEEKLKKLKG